MMIILERCRLAGCSLLLIHKEIYEMGYRARSFPIRFVLDC